MATTENVEKELEGLERKYWEAIRDQDVDAALALTDDPCIVAGASGVASIGPDAYRKMMQSGSWKLNDFELKDTKVRLVGDDVAIVAYKVKENLTVDGKPLSLEAADASTWVKRDGKWKCALHTESLTGDPFGRDRTKTS
jgi:uncharacterized protein (TIGR02246 family)